MLSETLKLSPGSVVGPYRVVRGFKGRGGMAGVFEVEVRKKYHQPPMPRRLALKVAKENCQDALVAEADFLRRFDHPNVVRIYPLAGYHKPVYSGRERFPFGWGWYYTMELLTAGSLERRLTRTTTGLLSETTRAGRQLGLLETLGIARQIAAALEHTHGKNVINLDVKPGNVLFRRRRLRFLRGSVPQAVLCDFGIARDLRYPRAGLLGVATPDYVSPEQTSEMGRRYKRLDVRSDIFSLGTTIYEMLTGELPFENIVLVADPDYVPTRPSQLRRSISDDLDDVVMRALAKDPARRFQSATEMVRALDRVPTPIDWKAGARRVTAGAALVGAVTLGGWGAKTWITPPPPTPDPPTLPHTATPTRSPTPDQSPTQTVMPTNTRSAPTSTPAPTATNTLPPPPTPTPEPEGG